VGDSLALQQQVAGTWHTQLSLSLASLTDSLLRHYGRNHASNVDLPAPVELRAHAGGRHLRLFSSSLSRDGAGREARYSYLAQGELHVET
jgi:hypothetical protein